MHLYSDISAEWYICCAGKHRLKCKRKVKKDLQTNYRYMIVCKELPLIHCRRDEARKCGGTWGTLSGLMPVTPETEHKPDSVVYIFKSE